MGKVGRYVDRIRIEKKIGKGKERKRMRNVLPLDGTRYAVALPALMVVVPFACMLSVWIESVSLPGR